MSHVGCHKSRVTRQENLSPRVPACHKIPAVWSPRSAARHLLGPRHSGGSSGEAGDTDIALSCTNINLTQIFYRSGYKAEKINDE